MVVVESNPAKIWAVEPGPGALAVVRARDAAEELTRRRAVYFQGDLAAPLEVLVACAQAWSAVAVAECAAAAEERARVLVRAAPACRRFVSAGGVDCVCGRSVFDHGRPSSRADAEWWTVARSVADDADRLAEWCSETFGAEDVEILSRRGAGAFGELVELEVRRGA